MNEIKEIITTADTFEIIANEKDLIIIERQLIKHTKLDIEIQNLSIPENPKWLNVVIRLIRYYQKKLSPHLGNRCVFDPSCSRYSEQAFRKKGLLKGIQFTIGRLYRCRAKNGGIDLII